LDGRDERQRKPEQGIVRDAKANLTHQDDSNLPRFLRDRRGSFYVYPTEAARKFKRIFDRQSHFKHVVRVKECARVIRV
jgi:hypothetical protein